MLPTEFIQRLKLIIPAPYFDGVLESFSLDKPTSFRINTLKNSIEDACAQLKKDFDLQSIEWYSGAFLIPSSQRDLLLKSKLFSEGKIYLQSLSSMLPPLVLNPQPGEEILDLTAAPGSKTTQMACMMNNQGRIAAVEKSKTRFFKLKNNIQQQESACVKLYLKDGAHVWRNCYERFDRVLLDAPCSSESRFNANDAKSYQYWSLKKINDMSHKQWLLMESAFKCLKPNGVLVYSTCTFAPEENEAIVAKLLDRYKNAQIQNFPIDIENVQKGITVWNNKKFSDDIQNAVRIFPDHIMDGFFICKIKKIM